MGLINKISKGTVHTGKLLARGTQVAFVTSETDADILLMDYTLFIMDYIV